MSRATDLLAEAVNNGFADLSRRQLLAVIAQILAGESIEEPSNLSGDGPPAPELGVVGSTYVDVQNNSFYWKATDGWYP